MGQGRGEKQPRVGQYFGAGLKPGGRQLDHLLIAVIILLIAAIVLGGLLAVRTRATLPTLAPVKHDFTLEVGEQRRQYRLHVPPAAREESVIPLVIVLHGGGGAGSKVQEVSQMDRVADTNRFLVAYPEGTRGPAGGNTWNGGDCCGVAMLKQTDDVKFISTLIDTLVADFNVDQSRVYITGVSNGAIMAYRLGCELSEKVAAIAAVAGASMLESCEPSRPVPIMIIHGTADQEVPIEGGQNPQSVARRPFPPLSATLRTWRSINGCTTNTKLVFQEGMAKCSTFLGCADGAQVLLCLIEGGGHEWPSEDFSASEEMWSFFARHSLP